MKKLLTLLIVLSTSFFSYSQLSNKHWMPPLHANEDQDSDLIRDHYIYLSTPEATPFQVTVITGNGTPIAGSPFTISQGNPVRVLIGNGQPSIMFLDKFEVGTVTTKGLYLEGIYDFYVSFRVRSDNHAEFLSSKGLTGAGTVFRLGSLPQNDTGGIRNFMSSFVALENNTTVNLSDYDANIQFISGNTILTTPNQTFTLNKGQSVVVSGNASTAANLKGFVGALLTSDKPIVVNTGNLAAGMLAAQEGQDFNLDQIVPLDQVGTEYIIMRGNGSNNSELPLVIAHENNTEIFVNGNTTPVATINAGDYFLIPSGFFQGAGLNANMYINTSKPVFLYQIIAGSTSDATSGFYFIPPLNCFWQKSVDLIPDIQKISPSDNFTGSVIIATEINSIVSINNVATTQAPIPVLGNPNWVSYKISGLTGNVKIESTGALAVGVFGASGNAGYGGYFSGFGSLPKDSETIVCSNATVDLFDRIPGNPETPGTWTYNGVPRVPNNGLFNPLTDPIGSYVYTFSKTCDGNTRIYPITIEVTAIETAPNAGTSATKAYCINDASEDLFTLLGTADATGNWSLNGSPRANGIFDPATDSSGNYIYTIPASGACEAVSATVAVIVNPVPQIAPITSYELCDDAVDSDDTNGFVNFTLNTKNTEALNGQTGRTVTYHESQVFAEQGINALPTTYYSDSKTIYVRLRNNTTQCYAVTTLDLIVNPLPISQPIVTLKQCDTDTDAITSFNLTQANSIISNDTSLTFSYHLTQAGANNNTNLVANETEYVASNGSVVWARTQTASGCSRTTRVNLIVSATTLSQNDSFDLYECDEYIDINDTDVDGYDYFNLNDINDPNNNAVLHFKNLFPANQNLVVTFYENETDALAEENQILDITNYRNIAQDTQIIWVRLDSTLNNECFGLGPYLTLNVVAIPAIDLGTNFTVCVDRNTGLATTPPIIDATPSTVGDYSYSWTPANPNVNSTGNEMAQYTVNEEGTYAVIVTDNLTGCENFDSITITFSSEPAQFEASIINPALSSGVSTIEAIATGGFGTYEYSLDQVAWQSSPTFTNVTNGSYTVYVRDIQGCDILSSSSLYAITYPAFFTPNGDGYNDFWNITNLPESFLAKLYIFDRYGKLLKQISSYGQGWDGTFNGQQLPSDDYWFKLEYVDNQIQKEFKSHFTLKR